jgi:hypothetical protein
MPPEDDLEDSALGRALRRRKELQEIIKNAVQELKRLDEWLQMHRELSTGQGELIKGAVETKATTLRLAAGMGKTQDVFESLVLAVLRDVGRPMRSPELIEEFRKRGHPMQGNEIRTAWNRLWEAKTRGVLVSLPKLGYWIAGEPLSEEAKGQALIASKRRNKSGVSAVIEAARGKKKGPTEIWGPEEIAAAERMLLAGKSRTEVAAALGGVSQGTIQTYLPGGIRELQKRHPHVVIPKRPYVYRPPRPGHKPTGRPRTVTPEQEAKMGELRSQGKSHSEIAEVMGIKRSTVSSYLARLAKTSEPPK